MKTRYKNLGGILYFQNKKIKPNETFVAESSEVPKSFKNALQVLEVIEDKKETQKKETAKEPKKEEEATPKQTEEKETSSDEQEKTATAKKLQRRR